MSLITAMSGMLDNTAAMEAAEDMMMFEEDFAMEADELIDIMVDGKVSFADADEIDRMDEEDAIEDQINYELETEDRELYGVGVIDYDAPDTRVGWRNSSPDPSWNQSGGSRLTHDQLKTRDGSVGQRNSTATPEWNVSKAHPYGRDRYGNEEGSIGQRNSSPNAVNESYTGSFMSLIDDTDAANESFFDMIMNDGYDITEESYTGSFMSLVDDDTADYYNDYAEESYSDPCYEEDMDDFDDEDYSTDEELERVSDALLDDDEDYDD